MVETISDIVDDREVSPVRFCYVTVMVPKSNRRSVSPFGFKPEPESEFAELESRFAEVFGQPDEGRVWLSSWKEAKNFPFFLRGLAEAAANDAGHLELICQFALKNRIELESKGLQSIVFSAMEIVFGKKTELFLLSGPTPENPEKTVLFAKERDHLVGRYFFPVSETAPGEFAAFVRRWIGSNIPDRLLHFFDFAAGSNDPTFEYYLVFAHPELKRTVSNKGQLRTLWKSVEPLALKVAGGEWVGRIKKSLDL